MTAPDEITESRQASERERSTIAFPYGDLNDAIRLVTALHQNYGGRGSLDQLAAALGTTVKSGSFRLRMATARIFGVIDGRGTIALTELGRRVIDPSTELEARATAFLRVPLYRAIYESHQGATLPGDRGLEAEMKDLGVSEKQVAKARQAFQRSAEQAGFFEHGKDRLVAPAAGAVPPRPGSTTIDVAGDRFEHEDPLIVGLFRKLPSADAPWPSSEQEKWIELARHILLAVYGSGGGPAASSDVVAET